MTAPEETTALAPQETALAARAGVDGIKERLELLKQLKGALTSKVDYGTIPGCGDKPTLFKPGAEKTLIAFGLATLEGRTERRIEGDIVEFQVTLHSTTEDGIIRGTGMGIASTGETKYAWRKAVCDAEYDATSPANRQKKWWPSGEYTLQVRVPPEDRINTVLKMAFKRAKVALALDSCAASEFFSQDLEDLPDHDRQAPADDQGRRGATRDGRQRQSKGTQGPTPRQAAWAAAQAAGLDGNGYWAVVRQRQAEGALPRDEDSWTDDHVKALKVDFQRAAQPPAQGPTEGPPSAAYEEAMRIAANRGATDAQVTLATQKAFLASTPPSSWVSRDMETFLGKLEDVMGPPSEPAP